MVPNIFYFSQNLCESTRDANHHQNFKNPLRKLKSLKMTKKPKRRRMMTMKRMRPPNVLKKAGRPRKSRIRNASEKRGGNQSKRKKISQTNSTIQVPVDNSTASQAPNDSSTIQQAPTDSSTISQASVTPKQKEKQVRRCKKCRALGHYTPKCPNKDE